MANLSSFSSSSQRPATIPRETVEGSSKGVRPYLIAGQRRRPANPKPSVNLLPNETEDAYITGATRSLDRRLLALNLPHAPQPPVSERASSAPAATRASTRIA